MLDYKASFPFNTPAYILPVTGQKTVKGVLVKTFANPGDSDSILINCSYKTYGGTEQNKNGVYSVVDTGNVETWYRPDIKADCRFCLAENPQAVYEILGNPENINMNNQYLKFKVMSVGGGA